MDSDEFEEYIEFDDEGEENEEEESEKENEPLNPIKQPRTTPAQFDRIAAFVNECPEKVTDKATYKLLWENLAAQLNDIGPPNHSADRWKRIWSVHKYNKKRKRAVDESDTESDTDRPGNVSHLDQPPHVIHPVGFDDENVVVGPSVIENVVVGPSVIENVGIDPSEISNQLGVIIDNQNTMIAIQGEIIQELRDSNKLLQEIAKKA